MTPIGNEAIGANNLYQAALRTLRPDNVWQYYVLVDAQWGASAKPLGVPNQPKWLANTTLETYLQTASESKRDASTATAHSPAIPISTSTSPTLIRAKAMRGRASWRCPEWRYRNRRRYFHSAKPMPQPVPAAER